MKRRLFEIISIILITIILILDFIPIYFSILMDGFIG